ncbi:MAG: alkaline phosphatase D family protein [Pirellulaceae bacterium]|nr:alkaline phosphatase D family protein [Pirellulaceae bacterium]
MHATATIFRRTAWLVLLVASLVSLSAARCPGQTAAATPPADKDKFHLFLLVGQSNMAGRGRVEPQDQVAHPRLLTLDKELQWQPAVDPLHFDKPAVVGVGLGRTFGLQLVEADPEITVGLIPCAVGGSPIASWQPGGRHAQTNTQPYDDALRRARHALRFGQLRGILWHQGESDATPELAGEYQQRLHELIARLRKDLQAEQVPFIAGQMGQFAERPWDAAHKLVDAAHQSLPAQVPRTALVSSEGLGHKGDQVHFDAASYRELGRRYAAAYRGLLRTRILFGSCARQERPMPIFETIVGQHPDLFVFLGDNIYADTTDMRVMRAKYDQLQADPGFARLRKACPNLATWDDHDYGQNDAGADYPQREASRRLFLDFWSERADSPRRSRAGVYDARVFGPVGQRVQIILLDTRYFRGPLRQGAKREGGPYVPGDDPAVPLLGEEQWAWLREQLTVPAELRVIATSIQCVAQDAGQECWANLPHERQRFYRLLDETRAEGVLLISGDRHWAELSVNRDALPYPLYDLTSSSFNQPHPRGTPTENRFRDNVPTWHQENFGAIEIDWRADDPQLVLQIRDLQGQPKMDKRIRLSQLRRGPAGGN